jgi:hypothetical protein
VNLPLKIQNRKFFCSNTVFAEFEATFSAAATCTLESMEARLPTQQNHSTYRAVYRQHPVG